MGSPAQTHPHPTPNFCFPLALYFNRLAAGVADWAGGEGWEISVGTYITNARWGERVRRGVENKIKMSLLFL